MSEQSTLWTRRGGWSLIAATVLFIAEFTYLATVFNYPDVLDGAAGDVLPRLLGLGTTGRTVWFVYGLTPLLLIPAAKGIAEVARRKAPKLATVTMVLAALSAACMMIGLLRWPTLHWTLAQTWINSAPVAQSDIASLFVTANLWLGNVTGEFFGELFLNGFFLSAAIVVSAAPRRTWLLYAGVGASVLGWLAMLRNLTPLVSSIAAVNNSVLPLWMLVLGIALVRQSTAATTPAT